MKMIIESLVIPYSIIMILFLNISSKLNAENGYNWQEDLAHNEFWDLYFRWISMLNCNVRVKCSWSYRRLEAVLETDGDYIKKNWF